MKTCFKKNKVKIKNFEKNENDFKYNQLQWSRINPTLQLVASDRYN